MNNVEQFRTLILNPTLQDANLYSQEASDLLLGTILAESNLKYFKQIGGGPALGFVQMEPGTFNDIFYRYLERDDKRHLKEKVRDVMVKEHPFLSLTTPLNQLMTNLPFAVLMARIRYLMVPHAIPHTSQQQAVYWKKYYNTEEGAGSVTKYLSNWNKYLSTKNNEF